MGDDALAAFDEPSPSPIDEQPAEAAAAPIEEPHEEVESVEGLQGEAAEESLSPKAEATSLEAKEERPEIEALPNDLRQEIKSVLSYMDQLLDSLPEEKIEEFARSKHFEVYKKLFEDLGIS